MILLEHHEIAQIFPMMEKVEFSALVEDIRRNGLRTPVVLYEGKMLDGRNRYRACLEAGVKPHSIEYEGNDPVGYIVSANLHRRHLSSSQRAACAVEAEALMERLEAEARERMLAGKKADPEEIIPEGRADQARDTAAALFGTNPHYIQDAKKIQAEDPDAFEQVKSGKKTISQVKREIRHASAMKNIAVLPSDKYRVLLADPPWKYGSDFSSGEEKFMKRWTSAETHYPAMSIVELCALPVIDLSEDNAVLFLWVTSPLLAECWPVIKAWGFSYKSSFCWDKVRHNFGHYNSVRHEFLLVCTRGSCLPDIKELHDSVVEIERSEVHSEKPAYFRELIDKMYPRGNRIELFARQKVDSWDSWGSNG